MTANKDLFTLFIPFKSKHFSHTSAGDLWYRIPVPYLVTVLTTITLVCKAKVPALYLKQTVPLTNGMVRNRYQGIRYGISKLRHRSKWGAELRFIRPGMPLNRRSENRRSESVVDVEQSERAPPPPFCRCVSVVPPMCCSGGDLPFVGGEMTTADRRWDWLVVSVEPLLPPSSPVILVFV